jgi:hypothetical protein
MMSIIIEQIIKKQNITTETLSSMISEIQDINIRKKFDAYLNTVKSYENKIIEALFGENNSTETF